MNSTLIGSYLKNKDNIEVIQAYALWAHHDIKKELLSFENKEQLSKFLSEMTGGRKYAKNITYRNNNAKTISYSINFPIGYTFSMKVADLGHDICIVTIFINI